MLRSFVDARSLLHLRNGARARKRASLAAALLAIACGWLAGCANQQPTQSGFLSDYRSLRQVDTFGKVLERRPTPSTLARYSSVYIEPVVNRLPAEIAPADAAKLAELTASALKAELGKQWTIVSSPAPGAIRVRSALTAVRKSNPPVNLVLTAVAVPLINGGLSAEAEFLAAPNRRNQLGRRGAAQSAGLLFRARASARADL